MTCFQISAMKKQSQEMLYICVAVKPYLLENS